MSSCLLYFNINRQRKITRYLSKCFCIKERDHNKQIKKKYILEKIETTWWAKQNVKNDVVFNLRGMWGGSISMKQKPVATEKRYQEKALGNKKIKVQQKDWK